ncbi:sirohydrochlorin cobaltochelatase [Konateibacter massiliensis]|uniref:sirohydrochlorin cobaltochelatase n=1 Tax=Konateibacter massiliensis TaxID=2002841 RepID=UPI000C151A78|nr:sirohydrochlorin cobaltochelatase [Konateibacter massiliensis]
MLSKKAILVVSFGTSYLDTLEKNIKQIEDEIQENYPDYHIYRAFTSQMIIKKLQSVCQISIDTVTEAMERMKKDGITELLVQPTHIIHGIENDNMINDISRFKDDFTSIKLGTPLLSSFEDYKKAVAILMEKYKPKDDEALVLMGHGSIHYANASYPALDYTFRQQGYSNVYVGTVEGYPELEDVISLVKEQNVTNVKLLPLMLVAGDHAKNDMDGSEKDSWKSRFIQEGFSVQTIVKGLGEIKEFRQLYLDHLKEAVSL